MWAALLFLSGILQIYYRNRKEQICSLSRISCLSAACFVVVHSFCYPFLCYLIVFGVDGTASTLLECGQLRETPEGPIHPGAPRKRATVRKVRFETAMMKEIEIKTPAQIQKLSELASQEPYDISLVTSTVILDARSLLGLYSLIGQRVAVSADDHADPKRFGKFLEKID